MYLLCSQIPAGKFSTYKAIAEELKTSPRAVGNALRRNPFAPKVPCHRVMSSDFSIGGFQGGKGHYNKNVLRKKELLEVEGLHFDDQTLKVAKEQQSSCFYQTFTKKEEYV